MAGGGRNTKEECLMFSFNWWIVGLTVRMWHYPYFPFRFLLRHWCSSSLAALCISVIGLGTSSACDICIDVAVVYCIYTEMQKPLIQIICIVEIVKGFDT